MTGAELGLLLLCCRLEDEVLPLTQAQYRALRQQIRQLPAPDHGDQALCHANLRQCGCSDADADRILTLLSRQQSLLQSLSRWKAAGIEVCTRLHPDYPAALNDALGDDGPPALFLSGDAALLSRPAVSLTGCRELFPENEEFARLVGRTAAVSGRVLISGNARGADRVAQEACLATGGSVISIVADRLTDHPPRPRMLYLCEESPFRPFSAARALSRNRCIYALGAPAFVAQVRDGLGGSWRGASQALSHGKNDLYVLQDGSAGANHLCQLGAHGILPSQLGDILK